MVATKSKSGKWTCCAYYKDADGKVHRPRFTADRKKDAERMAESYSLEHKNDCSTGSLMLFSTACKKYIDKRSKVLSPSTIKEYQLMVPRYLAGIGSMKVVDIKQDDVQTLINELAGSLSPKSIRNIHGFISSVLAVYRPELTLRTSLPQAVRTVKYTPTDEEVKKLLDVVRGSSMEVPVYLAALSSLRRSEVCALDVSDIGDGWIKVDKALVMGPDRKWHIKTTKTINGTRITYLPKEVTDRIKEVCPKSGRVVPISPNSITAAMPHLLKKAGLPRFRFHALRSYYASVLHYLGVPDKYIMEWGGWKDEGTLRGHYEKAMPDKVPEMAAIGIDHFSKLVST